MINIYSFWLNCTKNQDDKPLLSLIVDSEVRGTTLQKLIVDSEVGYIERRARIKKKEGEKRAH